MGLYTGIINHKGLVWSFLLGVILLAAACRKEQQPTPQNVIKYETGGKLTGRVTGNSLDLDQVDFSFNYEAYLPGNQSGFAHDTVSEYQVRDTGTGPFIERTVRTFYRFNLYRTDPLTLNYITLQFALRNKTHDTASTKLGIVLTPYIRQALSPTEELFVQGVTANLPSTGVKFPDQTAWVKNVVWDSAANRISGDYQIRFIQQKSTTAPLDTLLFTGQFESALIRLRR